MKLSQNFSLREMTQSQTALRNDIDNTPNEAPIKITSGYRSAALCEKIGSSSNSQHCANNGAAADFEIFGYDNKEVASHIKNNFEFDQLILEYYNDSDINSGWIHCSFKSGANRKESLTKDKAGYQKWQ